MRAFQIDDDPRLQGIDANRAGSAFKDEDGKIELPLSRRSITCHTKHRICGSVRVVRCPASASSGFHGTLAGFTSYGLR